MKLRPSKYEYYLSIAKAIGQRSTCLRARFGAIIVKDDVIVSSGYVGAPRKVRDCLEIGICLKDMVGAPHGKGYDFCNSVHAEANAVINAARSGASILNGIMFMHGEDPKTGKPVEAMPCTFCRRLLINAGIQKIVFMRADGAMGEYSIDQWVQEETESHLKKIETHRKS